MMQLFAGYDSGGSKTACVLTDEQGALLGVGLGGPSNFLYCGKERALDSVITSTEAAFSQAGLSLCRLKAAYVGSAAIRMQGGAAHVPFFQSCIDAETVLCESDIFPIWYGAARGEPAAVTIAGTGAITYVCRKERYIRVSGWGPLLGDEGSGYDLGRRALQTAVRMADGREPEDCVFVREMFGLFGVSEPRDLVLLLNQGDIRSKVATAARPVFRLYEQGNRTAGRLLHRSAREIARSVSAALEQDASGEAIPLLLSGSLLRPKEALFSLVKEKLIRSKAPISSFLYPQVHPAAAAAALALVSQNMDEAAEALMQNARGRVL